MGLADTLILMGGTASTPAYKRREDGSDPDQRWFEDSAIEKLAWVTYHPPSGQREYPNVICDGSIFVVTNLTSNW